jgi:hypothetical protein
LLCGKKTSFFLGEGMPEQGGWIGTW